MLRAVWSDAHDQAFASLKAVLVHAVTLAVPNPEFEFLMFTDASEAVLVQHKSEQNALDVDERDLQTMAFASGWLVPLHVHTGKPGLSALETHAQVGLLALEGKGYAYVTDHKYVG
jgi:hypothetical protein